MDYFSLQLLKEYTLLKKSMFVCNWTKDLQAIIDNLALVWQKYFFPCILIICGMTFELEYLGEFKFILEII
jgi:hypothetical protein